MKIFRFLPSLLVLFPVVVFAAQTPSSTDLRSRADRLLNLRNQPVTQTTISAGPDQQDLIYVYGVPAQVSEIQHEGRIVFRHYSVSAIPKILASQSLKAGPRPYIDPYPHARFEYQDLTGPMFTFPDFPPNELWLNFDEKTPWVDFTFDPSIPVLKCKDGNYLVPTQKNYPEWIRREYSHYRETGVISLPSLETEFKRIDQEGGMQPQAEIPIRILGWSE